MYHLWYRQIVNVSKVCGVSFMHIMDLLHIYSMYSKYPRSISEWESATNRKDSRPPKTYTVWFKTWMSGSRHECIIKWDVHSVQYRVMHLAELLWCHYKHVLIQGIIRFFNVHPLFTLITLAQLQNCTFSKHSRHISKSCTCFKLEKALIPMRFLHVG